MLALPPTLPDGGLYLLFAKSEAEAGARGVTAFLREPTATGFRIGRYEDRMGVRLSHSAEVALEECEVPAEER